MLFSNFTFYFTCTALVKSRVFCFVFLHFQYCCILVNRLTRCQNTRIFLPALYVGDVTCAQRFTYKMAAMTGSLR